MKPNSTNRIKKLADFRTMLDTATEHDQAREGLLTAAKSMLATCKATRLALAKAQRRS